MTDPAHIPFVLAIDGTFASGKGTLARKLADHYGLAYLDTGKLYRAAAQLALQSDTDLTDAQACAAIAAQITPQQLSDPALKSGGIGAAASKISVHPPVRAALFDYQRRFAQQESGAVLDGRDIGTVICPHADVKLYIDADPSVRAHRRFAELSGYGEDTSFEQVLAQLTERDSRDKNRAEAPLKPAADAHLLDSTDLSIDAAFTAACQMIDAVLKAKGHYHSA